MSCPRRPAAALRGPPTQAKRHAIPLDLVRFTRRQLREHLAAAGAGWGDTQLKVHLARLADLELVVPHRLESGSYGYELTWNPPRETSSYDEGQRFLAGLTDPRTLFDDRPESTYDTQPVGPESQIHAYDPQPVGAEVALVGPWSGSGRGVVGPQSAPAVSSPPAGEDGAEQGCAVAVVGR